MELVQYLWSCYQAFRRTDKNSICYFAVMYRGVPSMTVMIARDRAAWQLSQFAIDHMEEIEPR